VVVLAKNYETTSTFVEVMQKKTVASFFWTRCIVVADIYSDQGYLPGEKSEDSYRPFDARRRLLYLALTTPVAEVHDDN